MNSVVKKSLIWTAAGIGAVAGVRQIIRLSRSIDLRGRTALVTGGSRGLGLVLARELAAEGARLALCARDADELDRARHDLAERGAEVIAVPCDVTVREDVESMVQLVGDRYGDIDVLINNAGTIQVGPFEVTTAEDYEQAMKTHFWGPLYTTMAVVPSMARRRSGRIVNISSIGGKVSPPHLLPYAASKFALTGFSEGLRAELAKDGVYVTTVIPGLMRTGSPRNAWFKGQHRAEYAWFTISDSLPVLSMAAESAARRIVSACKHGDAEIVLSLPAQAAVLFHGVFPGLTADLMALSNRLLPGPGGIGTDRRLGRDSESAATRSSATILTRQAALRNNEVAPDDLPPAY